MRIARRHWSVATRIFVAQVAALVTLSGVLTLLLWLDTKMDADRDAARVCLGVSETLAHDPFVIAGVQSASPSTTLQPYAVNVMDSAHLDFVTIMSPAGIRYTHRDPDQIGGRYLGSTAAALRGQTLTETFTGTLGPSVRAVAPVTVDGRVVALVSSGMTVTNVAATLASRLPFVFGAAALLVVLGSAGAYLARRYLNRVTGALGPAELESMVGYYEAVLHSAREGVILMDDQHRVVLYNDEAADLLGLPPATRTPPRAVSDFDLPASIAALLASGVRAVEEPHLCGDRVLLVNQEPALPAGATSGSLGSVMTLRDRTELTALSGELESVRTLSDALRAQNHEHANRLHTVVSLLELGRPQEAIEFVAGEVRTTQSLTDDLIGVVKQPALAALLLGKSGQAGERGISLEVTVSGDFAVPLSASELVSVVGNLIDNALDAAASRVEVRIGARTLAVIDDGRGVDEGFERRVFSRGFTTKANGHGFGLAIVREIVSAHGGTIRIDRRTDTAFIISFEADDA